MTGKLKIFSRLILLEEMQKLLKKTWIAALILTTAILLYLIHRLNSTKRAMRLSLMIYFLNFGFLSLFRWAWSLPDVISGGGSAPIIQRMRSIVRKDPEVVLLD